MDTVYVVSEHTPEPYMLAVCTSYERAKEWVRGYIRHHGGNPDDWEITGRYVGRPAYPRTASVWHYEIQPWRVDANPTED